MPAPRDPFGPVDRDSASPEGVPGTEKAALVLVYGVLRIGTAQVALQLDALREVVPCPARFESLPAAACGLLGALKLRGRVVPVLDLRHVLGLPVTTPLVEPVVVVMRHEGRLLGLLSDSVHGITRPRAGELHRMDSAEGGSLLFSGSFERVEDGSVVSVLDAAVVLRLPGLPTLRDETAMAMAAAHKGQARLRPPMMLVRCGGIGLALEVLDVYTTLPHVSVKPSCMGATVCPGLIEYRDIDVPALDPLALLGLGQLPPEERCQALLLRLPSGFVAVLVNQVIDIVQVADDERMVLSDAALPRPAFFSALLRPHARGEYLALSAGALAADLDVQGLSRMNVHRRSVAEAVQDTTESKGRSVISFDVGTQAATALLQVREIVLLPAERISTCSSHPAVLGLFTHRRQAVTLVCLARLMGGVARDGGGGHVLLIDVIAAPGEPSQAIGFVVPQLCGIETGRWEQPVAPGNSSSPSKAFAGFPLIEVGIASQRRTLPLVDLHALARTLILERRHKWPSVSDLVSPQVVAA